MKPSSALSKGSFANLSWLALFASALVALARADEKSVPVQHKDYTLFMGANFQLEQDHVLYPVVDISRGSFVIIVNGQRVLIPVDRDGVKMRVNETLRISPDEIAVRNLTAERAYTPATDPRLQSMRAAAAMADLSDLPGATSNAATTSQQMSTLAGGGAATYMDPYIRQKLLAGAAQADMDAQTKYNRLEHQSMDQQYTAGAFDGRLHDELAKERFDALEIDFKVSSAKPLDRPYLIFVATYHGSGDMPNMVHNWIFAKQLEAIGPRERHEHYLQGGLPPGFTLISTEFHLYNEGREVATEVSHKRVPLTSAEAYEYSTLEHISIHKKDSAAPIPAMGNLPSDFLIHLTADEVQGTFYAKVGADGKVRDVYKDEACTMKVENHYLAEGLKTILFEPAVQKGRAVDGVAKIRPNRIYFVIEAKT